MKQDINLKCRICGNEENNIHYEVTEMMFKTGEKFGYFECSSCSCLQIDELPENMARFYPANYYSFNTLPVIDKAKKLQSRYKFYGKGFLGRVISCFFPGGKRVILDFLSKEIGKGTLSLKSKILDVGAGNGDFLNVLADLGFENLTGIDPYVSADIIRENGVKILKLNLEDINETYDFIMFNHSLEHIYDQTQVFKSLNNILAKNGTCIIRIPVSSSYAWSNYGVAWSNLEAPRHFYLHSDKSMKLLSESCGFTVSDIIWDSTESQFIGSERHLEGKGLLTFKSSVSYRLLHFHKIRRFRKKASELNKQGQGDQACFFIKRK